MSIGTTPRKAGPYPGNGVAAAFPFEFKVFAPADVLVVRAVVATGAEATLVLGTHYTVALNSDQKTSPGGTVTLIGGPLAADFTLTIGSAVPATQPAEFTNLGRFYPRVLNDSLDRLTILVQQLAEQVGRSLKIGFSSAAEASPDALLAALGSASSAASAAATTATGAADTAVAAAASATNRVSKTGDTMTGPLTLPGNASQPLHAVPKQQAESIATAAAASAAAPFAGRNRIINGTFAVNQRVFAGGALTAGVYGHDRWKAGAGGATYTVSGEIATITSGTLQQVIESVNVSEGGTYTLSWTGTAQARVDGGSYAASPITVTGKAAATNTTVEFGTGTVSRVQYEAGAATTAFERRHHAIELVLCQRYYESGSGVFAANVDGYVGYRVTKRATPTASIGAAGGTYTNGPSVFPDCFYARYNVTSGFGWSVSAEL